jgi:hypothetical protein
LVREFYPSTIVRDGLSGNASLLNSAQAERVLGYRAKHSWREYRLPDAEYRRGP